MDKNKTSSIDLGYIAYLLTLIGGLITLAWSLLAVFAISLVSAIFFFIPFFGAGSIILSLIHLAAGGVAIWAAFQMKLPDMEKIKTAGIVAIVAGIFGFNFLVVLGGVLALVKAGQK